MFRAWFFDMDGVLFDSMPNHALAWEQVMSEHHLLFTARDCYLNEGRTGQDVISEALTKNGVLDVTQEEIWGIYKEKTDRFHQLGGALPMRGISEVLNELKSSNEDVSIWVVTGSGQKSLLDHLNESFVADKGNYFSSNRMVTAFDVKRGKPNPEPYLIAWQRSGLSKEECVVVENAPMGVQAAKAAGLFTIAVNTGILSRSDLWQSGADMVFDDMYQLCTFIELYRHIENNVLPYYRTFDKGHNINHVNKVIAESLSLCRQLETEQKNTLNKYGLQALDCSMVYAIAAYHDLGLRIDRPNHHLHSGDFIRKDQELRRWFSEEHIEIMAQAVEDHRASRKEPPRSIYGCVVAEADRDIEPITILHRTIQFSLKHYPQFNKLEHLNRAYDHMIEKYSETGYLKLWMRTARNEKGLNDLRAIIHNKEELLSICSKLYDEELSK